MTLVNVVDRNGQQLAIFTNYVAVFHKEWSDGFIGFLIIFASLLKCLILGECSK